MAKRSKRSRSKIGAARAAIGGYVESGSKQVNETVTSFLSMFDTGQLIAALKRQAQAAGHSMGMKGGRGGKSRTAGRKKTARATTATRGKARKTTRRRKTRRTAR